MKLFKIFTVLAVASFTNAAFGYGLECVTQSHMMDYLTLDRDGGEETITVNYLSEKKERYLVIKNTGEQIQAVVDRDIEAGSSNRELTIILDQSTAKGSLNLNGNIMAIECRSK